MADTIRVTPKELQDKAQLMENTGNEIKNLSQNMTAKVMELTGRIWSGEAQQALYTIAAEYSTTEETNIAASGNLSEHVIA